MDERQQHTAKNQFKGQTDPVLMLLYCTVLRIFYPYDERRTKQILGKLLCVVLGQIDWLTHEEDTCMPNLVSAVFFELVFVVVGQIDWLSHEE